MSQQLVVAALVDLFQIGQRHRVADAGHDVLALRVLQVVPVDALRAGGRVAGERHAGAGVHAQIAEHHRDDVHRGAQVGRDPFLAPVDHRPRGVPRVEHRANREVHLLARFLRELATGVLDHDLLERLDEPAQVGGVEVQVTRDVVAALRCAWPRPAPPRTPPPRCPAPSCRTSGSAGGTSRTRTARCRPAPPIRARTGR